MYFYALPTMAQARRVAWEKIVQLVPTDWIEKVSLSAMRIDTIFGSSLHIVGMDKPQRIEGSQWDGGVIDESSDQKPRIFDLNIRPALSHRNAWCWRIGVPKRYGVGAKEFKEFWQRGKDGDKDIESFQWPSEDILTPEECAAAQRIMDPRDYNEQYRAGWEQVGGCIFYAFDSVLNVREVAYRPDLPLIVGSDFNVDPMAWVVAQEVNGCLNVLDELFIRNTNTRETLDTLYNKYGKSHQAGFRFYGDASGAARKTSASTSDYIQIRNDRRFYGARVYYPTKNPRIKDRFAACNAMFCNAADERRTFIHPRCKHLIDDLGDRNYKEGSSEPDDYNDLGHMTDALGYIIHHKWPVALDPTDSTPMVSI
jgi:hypothetical protein